MSIQVFRPKLNTPTIIEELRKALDSGWIGLGAKVAQFEAALSNYISPSVGGCGTDAPIFIATNSCTSALHLAVKSLDLPVRSKVITTPMTFVSTNHVLFYENLVPVFCDIEVFTGCIDPYSIEHAITKYPDIRAIIAVHFAGYPCDMNHINSIAKKHKIKVIEDCAHAFGARYHYGKKVGDTDNLCCWSFHAVKNLPVGDGGAISTKDADLVKWLKKMRWLGINKDTITRFGQGNYKWEYEVDELGYKYHMNDIAAIIGIEQLKTVDADNDIRRGIAYYYQQYVNGTCVKTRNYIEQSSCHFFPILMNRRDKVLEYLAKHEIYCGVHYKRNDKYFLYENCPHVPMPSAKAFDEREITLPIHLCLTNDDVKRIVFLANKVV